MKSINIAIVGATGLVGRKILEIFEEKRYIKINRMYLFASINSAGKILKFKNEDLIVEELSEENIKNKKIDFALFAAGGEISRIFAPVFIKNGTIVIDNSSFWRTDPNVPLVVPEVNGEIITKDSKLISNPNCSTIQCMKPLEIVNNLFEIKKIVFTTYQSVSGSGINGIKDLERTAAGKLNEFYPYPIYNNCLPHIDKFLENGYTKEEIKMVGETKKILELNNIKISATCVRVPVKNCHSVDIYVECRKKININKFRKEIKACPNLKLLDDVANNIYPVCTCAYGTDKVFVGRTRVDLCGENVLRFFTVADNIRKGAASNAIEILEYILDEE